MSLHNENPSNHQSNSNSEMIEEQYEESNNFTQRQIQIIRSYIADLNIDSKSQISDFSHIVQKIQRQTPLENKSAKQIQDMIRKLLFSSDSSGSSNKQSRMEAQNNSAIQIEKSEAEDQPQKPAQNTIKGSLFQKPQQNSFQPKFLFRSFNDQVGQKESNKEAKQLNSDNNDLQWVRKINLFTNPSHEFNKKASNGFKSIFDTFNISQKQSMEAQGNQTIEIPSFCKKATKQFKEVSEPYQCKSKRKIKPTNPVLIDPLLSPQQKIQWVEANTHDCHTILEKKMVSKVRNNNKDQFFVSQKFSSIYNQYFYSNYDKAYFTQQNPFSKLINYIGLDPKRINFKEFKLIKKALPKPKLFNIEFVISQQNKLNEFRSHLRQIPKDRMRNEDIELVVGRQVTALHPVCGHLHNGTILAIYKQNQYMVKFTRPQLGTQKVLDINISTRFLSGNNKATIENLDYQSMVVVIKLLQYKGDLLQKFKRFNNIIQELKNDNKEPDNHLLQQYGWLGSTINILSMGLRHIMAKFRIRGLSQANQQVVGKNFSSLLVNPLNLMHKQLQNSSEQSDIEASNQIKRMAYNRSQARIEDCLKRLELKNCHFIQQSETMNPEQKESMGLLVKNFIGMLLNFRFQGRNFSIESNRFLHNIHSLIDSEYAEEFNEIYDNVRTIVKKIGQTQ